MAGKQKHAIMLSSTYKELAEHRQAVREAILGQELFPEAMENDAALPDHDLISASLEKVDKADAYVGLIGYRYGQTPECSARNPDNLSLTELEFRRALERKIPICMFIMHEDHSVTMRAVNEVTDAEKQRRDKFIALAKENRIYAEFKSVEDLKAKAAQSLVKLREAIEKRTPSFVPPAGAGEAQLKALDVPSGWEIIDRDVLAKFRANPPSLDLMVQFFDGILPTWRLALAPGLQPRAIAERLANRLRVAHAGAAKPQVVLLTGAGGEGKSTALLHAAASLIEDPEQVGPAFIARRPMPNFLRNLKAADKGRPCVGGRHRRCRQYWARHPRWREEDRCAYRRAPFTGCARSRVATQAACAGDVAASGQFSHRAPCGP